MTAPDGCIHMTAGNARRIHLVHFLSGLDHNATAPYGAAAMTSITGYTEWKGSSLPRITIGWDWEMIAVSGAATLRRLSVPRSNIMLETAESTDRVLGVHIDSFDWQRATLRYLKLHYSK